MTDPWAKLLGPTGSLIRLVSEDVCIIEDGQTLVTFEPPTRIEVDDGQHD